MALTFEDYLPVILAAVLTFIASFVVLIIGRHMNVFDKTRQQSTLSPLLIENVQEDLGELKQMHKDLIGAIEDKLEVVGREHKEEFRRIHEKVDKMNTELYNIGWRVRELENHFKRGSNGGNGGSIM